MTRKTSILALLAAVLFTAFLAGCATNSVKPNSLSGQAAPSTNINARFPTLPAQ